MTHRHGAAPTIRAYEKDLDFLVKSTSTQPEMRLALCAATSDNLQKGNMSLRGAKEEARRLQDQLYAIEEGVHRPLGTYHHR